MMMIYPSGKTQHQMDQVEIFLAAGKSVAVVTPNQVATEPWRKRFGDQVKYIVGDQITTQVDEPAPDLHIQDEHGVLPPPPGEPPAIKAKTDQVNKEMREILSHYCDRCGQPLDDHAVCKAPEVDDEF